jgi:hypothetical protein
VDELLDDDSDEEDDEDDDEEELAGSTLFEAERESVR